MQSLDTNMASPELWRKSNSRPAGDQKQKFQQPHQQLYVGEQKPFVDTLKTTREKKWFFDTVEQDDSSYFPYGAPGSGAPLRNPDTNEIVSKLPHIEERLWKVGSPTRNEPSPTRFQSQSNNFETVNNKRQEIHNFIDEITRPKQQSMNNYAQEPQNLYTRPKKVKNVDPNHYWNDWWGRPGAGAPNWDTRKQNLEGMLEPRQQFETSRSVYRPAYDPTASLGKRPVYLSASQLNSTVHIGTPRTKFRSNHHNNYEAQVPPQRMAP